MNSLKKLTFLAVSALLILAVCTLSFQAGAQEPEGGLMPPATLDVDSELDSGELTHPPLRLTPDVSQIINLDEGVERVVIGNNNNLNLFLDTATRVIAVPRAPGATHFTLLGKGGKVIMRRHVIVASPEQKYVRIRQTCGNRAGGCISMFYCPDICHEVAIDGGYGWGWNGSLATDGEDDEDSEDEDSEDSEEGGDGNDDGNDNMDAGGLIQ